LLFELNQCITLDKASKLLFMLDPSQNRIPFALVLLTASLPAKSTRLSIDDQNFSIPFSKVLISMFILKTV